jgi:hypothetical protein
MNAKTPLPAGAWNISPPVGSWPDRQQPKGFVGGEHVTMVAVSRWHTSEEAPSELECAPESGDVKMERGPGNETGFDEK